MKTDTKFTDKVEAPVEGLMKTALREKAFQESNEQGHRVSEAHIVRKALGLYMGGVFYDKNGTQIQVGDVVIHNEGVS